MAELVLGLDVGTQGTKGLLVDVAARRVVARASASYGLIEGLEPGAAEQHPDTWIEAVRAVAAELRAQPGVRAADVAAVGVSGQQHGCVLLDEADLPLRPAKLWCDTTTAAEAAELTAAIGRAVPAGFTAPKMLWSKRREPELWARVRAVLLPHDFVNLRLTGARTTEAGDASGTGLLDPRTRRFDERALAAIGPEVAAMLPPLVPPGAPAGRLSADGAALLGLPEGVLVAAGGGDNMMSAIGSGATRPGVVVVSLGTSGTVFTHAAEPVIDPEGLIAPFCDSTGGWLPLLCVMNMTGVLEEVRAAFPGASWAELEREAAAVPAGADGLLLVPYLAGERVPDLPHATGALLGLRPGLLRRGHLFRAALEGTSLSLALGLDRLRALGVAVDSVRLVGGGARNALWRRILASALNAEVRALAEPESAALGAALQALWTLRRASDPSITADAVAAPFVAEEGEPVAPEPAAARLYAGGKERLAGAARALFAR